MDQKLYLSLSSFKLAAVSPWAERNPLRKYIVLGERAPVKKGSIGAKAFLLKHKGR